MTTLAELKNQIQNKKLAIDPKSILKDLLNIIEEIPPTEISAAAAVIILLERRLFDEDDNEEVNVVADTSETPKLEDSDSNEIDDEDFSSEDEIAKIWFALAQIKIINPNTQQVIQKLSFLLNGLKISDESHNSTELLKKSKVDLEQIITTVQLSPESQKKDLKKSFSPIDYNLFGPDIFFNILYYLYDEEEKLELIALNSTDRRVVSALKQLQCLESTTAPFTPKNISNKAPGYGSYLFSIVSSLASTYSPLTHDSEPETHNDQKPTPYNIFSILLLVREYEINHSNTAKEKQDNSDAFSELCDFLCETNCTEINQSLFMADNYRLLILLAKITGSEKFSQISKKTTNPINNSDWNIYLNNFERLHPIITAFFPTQKERMHLLITLRDNTIAPILFVAFACEKSSAGELLELWKCLTETNQRVTKDFLVTKSDSEQQTIMDHLGIFIIACFSRENAIALLDNLKLPNIIVSSPFIRSAENINLIYALLFSTTMGKQTVSSLITDTHRSNLTWLTWLVTKQSNSDNKEILDQLSKLLKASNYILTFQLYCDICHNLPRMQWLIRNIFSDDNSMEVIWKMGIAGKLAIIAEDRHQFVCNRFKSLKKAQKSNLSRELTASIMAPKYACQFNYDTIFQLLKLNITELTYTIANKIIEKGFKEFILGYTGSETQFKSIIGLLLPQKIQLDDSFCSSDIKDDEEYTLGIHPFHQLEIQLAILRLAESYGNSGHCNKKFFIFVKDTLEASHYNSKIIDVLQCQLEFEKINEPDKKIVEKGWLGGTTSRMEYSDIRLEEIKTLQDRYKSIFLSDLNNSNLQEANGHSAMTIGEFIPDLHRIKSKRFPNKTPISETISKEVAEKKHGSGFCSSHSFCG